MTVEGVTAQNNEVLTVSIRLRICEVRIQNLKQYFPFRPFGFCGIAWRRKTRAYFVKSTYSQVQVRGRRSHLTIFQAIIITTSLAYPGPTSIPFIDIQPPHPTMSSSSSSRSHRCRCRSRSVSNTIYLLVVVGAFFVDCSSYVDAIPPKSVSKLNDQKQQHQAKNDEMNKDKPNNDGSHTVQCPNQDAVCHCMADNCSALTPPPHKRSPFCVCPEAQECCHFQFKTTPKIQTSQPQQPEDQQITMNSLGTEAIVKVSSRHSVWTIGLLTMTILAVAVVAARRFIGSSSSTASYERSGLVIDNNSDGDDPESAIGYRDDVEEEEDDEDNEEEDVEIEEIEMTSSNESGQSS